jgi:hypothetical protein
MNIIKHLEYFPNKHSCRNHFKEVYENQRISGRGLQKQLCIKYGTAWSMMYRIRKAIGKRDSLYALESMIGFDEGYFTTETIEKDKNNLKRARGSQKKTNVASMIESTPLEDLKPSKHCRNLKMKVLEGHLSNGINEDVEEYFDERFMVLIDKSAAAFILQKYVGVHVYEESTKETT